MTCARSIRVRGVVQGVGFRPFVFRLAHANTLAGWVLNGEEGVEIHLEGAEPAVDAFLRDLQAQPPPAARITALEVRSAEPAGFQDFSIRESRSRRPALHPHLARSAGLRRVPRGAVRPRGPPLSGIPTSTAPTAARATPSSRRFLTTGTTPP